MPAQHRAATTQTPRRPIGAGGGEEQGRTGSLSVTTTDALFAGEVQRKVSNGVASLAAAASSYRRKLLSSGARPGLRIANVAAQTRIVSAARPRLEFWKSVRPFKGIFCDDISEFESYMPSQAVSSLCAAKGS